MSDDAAKVREALGSMNLAWLRGPGANHWIESTWRLVHKENAEFAATSCLVTVEAGCELARPGAGQWRLRGAAVHERLGRPEPPYKVTWGYGEEGWQEAEHAVLVLSDAEGRRYLLQAFWRVRGPELLPLSPSLERLLLFPELRSNRELVTRTLWPERRNDTPLRAFVWLPPS